MRAAIAATMIAQSGNDFFLPSIAIKVASCKLEQPITGAVVKLRPPIMHCYALFQQNKNETYQPEDILREGVPRLFYSTCWKELYPSPRLRIAYLDWLQVPNFFQPTKIKQRRVRLPCRACRKLLRKIRKIRSIPSAYKGVEHILRSGKTRTGSFLIGGVVGGV